MLTVAIPKRNKLQNIIVLTPKDEKERLIFKPISKKIEKMKKVVDFCKML